jgi:hypothetical protein
MVKKSYNRPFLVVERFAPQEYCEICTTLLSNVYSNHKKLHLDLDGDKYFDKGQEYMATTGNVAGAVDGVYKSVQTYYFKYCQYPNYQSEERYWSEPSYEFPQAHDFTTTAFTINGQTKPLYKFYKNSVVDIRIKNGKAYINAS